MIGFLRKTLVFLLLPFCLTSSVLCTPLKKSTVFFRRKRLALSLRKSESLPSSSFPEGANKKEETRSFSFARKRGCLLLLLFSYGKRKRGEEEEEGIDLLLKVGKKGIAALAFLFCTKYQKRLLLHFGKRRKNQLCSFEKVAVECRFGSFLFVRYSVSVCGSASVTYFAAKGT